MHILKFILCTLVLILLPSAVKAEVINFFDAEYHINTDSTVTVTETITYDFEESAKHGIFRTLETDHTERATIWYKQRIVDIKDIEVSLNGGSVPFAISGSDNVEIKIGDPNITISGVNVYTITYTLIGALSYPANGVPELYWNFTGNDWPVIIEDVKVVVSSDVEISSASCYFGNAGDKTLCSTDPDKNWSFSAKQMHPGTEVTIAVGFTKGSILPIVAIEKSILVAYFLSLLFLLYPIFLIYILIRSRRYKYFYYFKRPIIAEYEPYSDVEPMMSGVLIDDILDTKDIAAGIVYLAQQNFIKIRKTQRKVLWLFNLTDYDVILLKSLTEIKSQFLKEVGLLFFVDDSGDPAVGTVSSLTSLRNNLDKKAKNIVALGKLSKAMRDDLTAKLFFEDRNIVGSLLNNLRIIKIFATVIILGLIVVIFFSFKVVLFLLGLFCVGFSLWVIDNFSRRRRRTKQGYEAKYHLLGFKHFLSVTDAKRFDFHNAPERSPEQFMQYLPYAIAFGVEKKWAELFEDMEITNPSWYEDTARGTFVATAFAQDLTSFTSSVSQTTQSSSGGGSAGGGGGGGSW